MSLVGGSRSLLASVRLRFGDSLIELWGGIRDLLERWGFVRLRDFGLVLTPDRRVRTTRPVLDDGAGGQIVGWQANDLAAAELEPWKPERPPAPIKRPLMRPPIPTRPTAPVIEEVVHGPASEAESEWDWEIAMARARAAADDLEQAAPPIQHLTLLAPELADDWNDEEWERQLAKARRHPTAPVQRASTSRIGDRPTEKILEPPPRKTVIPVPTLPVANDIAAVRPLEPPRRFPRATEQRVDEDPTRRDIAPAPARVRR